MGYTPGTDPDRPADNDRLFEGDLTLEDIAAMRKYENGLREETLSMTGREVHARLQRIEDEFKRLELVKEQLVRLKRITKAALLGPDVPPPPTFR